MKALLEKADSAARSAHLLLGAELFDDAVNRADYAMFDTARAFLLLRAGVLPTDIRRHAGVISRFSKDAVLTGLIDAEHGRALARAFDDRLIADYTERRMDAAEARTVIAKMDAFIVAGRNVIDRGDTAMTLDNRPLYTGGCQCGAVRFRIEGALGRASICHCRMCQKAFGAFYAPLVSLGDAVLGWTRGRLGHFQSSNHVRRGFCADCGTPMTYEAPDGLALSIGAFDDPSALAPAIQFGTEGRLAYVDHLFDLPGRETIEDEESAGFLSSMVSRQHPDHDTDDGDFAKGFGR